VIAEELPAVTVTPPIGIAVGTVLLPTYPDIVAAELDGAVQSQGAMNHIRMFHRLEVAADRGRICDEFTSAVECQIVIESRSENQQKIRRRAGWGIFEFICFLAACALVWPVAHLVGQRYFPNHSRTVFWIIMLTAYPVLGFAFCCLMHRLFRWDYNRRQNRTTHDDSK
jgi:hypothetical protein